MSTQQKVSSLDQLDPSLQEFDLLSTDRDTTTKDPAHPGPQGDDSTPPQSQAPIADLVSSSTDPRPPPTPQGGITPTQVGSSPVVTPPHSTINDNSQTDKPPPTANVDATPPHAGSDLATPTTAKEAVSPSSQGVVVDTTPISVDGATPLGTGKTSSSQKKKKKKKHKKRSANPITERSHVTKPVVSHMSSEQISSEMNQIDQFLQSLKMGTYDPIGAQTTTTKLSTTTAKPLTTTKPSTTTAAKPSTTTTTTPSTTAVVAEKEVPGVAKAHSGSLGLQLIGELQSSSSSDSDESSSESSDEESMVIIEERGGSEEEEERKTGRHEYPMTKNEINYRDLPPLESCDIPFPEGARLMPLGKVSHTTEQLVIIQSIPDTPPVDEGTVLWAEEKKSLSVIFEIFGPVKSPYYSVHVHTPDHAHTLGLDPGKMVYVIPGDAELTKAILEKVADQTSQGVDTPPPEDEEDELPLSQPVRTKEPEPEGRGYRVSTQEISVPGVVQGMYHIDR